MGGSEGLQEHVGKVQCGTGASARVLLAQWIRALQDPEGVSEEFVSSGLRIVRQSDPLLNPCRDRTQHAAPPPYCFAYDIGKTYRYTIELCHEQKDQLDGIPGAGGTALPHQAIFEGRRRSGAYGRIGASAIFDVAGDPRPGAGGAAQHPNLRGAAGAETSQRGRAGGPFGAARLCAQDAEQRGSPASAGFAVAARGEVVGAGGAAANRRIKGQWQGTG